MKITKDANISTSDSQATHLLWDKTAREISLETGIYIEVVAEYENITLTEIKFKVMDHEFGSLKELKKALDNKAFL